ncbi:MAG: HAMP domain-containing histidine kinase [Myxococcales bacterium]|nr:HAMP domain-containing histidine kinase [Myxococcales bacterium]
MRRPSLSLKLLLAMLLPSLLAFFAFGLLSRRAAALAVEAELGRRLQTIAQLLSRQIADDSVALLQPGDEDSRTHRSLKKRLSDARESASLARVYVFAVDHTARVDTGPAAIGERLYHLDGSRSELGQIFAGTKPVSQRAASSLLFYGHDGKPYKSGFAPIPSEFGEARFAVGVDGSAALYADLIGLQRTLLGVGALAAVLLTGLAILLGRRVSQPLRRLSEDAKIVGQGVLDRPVPVALRRGHDELAVLAQTLETMRQGLLQRDERMQMMLAGIAHEVRNPLGGMELFAGLLKEELTPLPDGPPPDLEQARGYVGRILRELAHLQKVVADFLLYARKPPPDLQPIDLRSLLHEVEQSARGRSGSTVEISVEITEPCPTLRADPQQLRRAIENLAQNAVQACEKQPSGRVLLSAERARPGLVRVCVADNGPGIAQDVLAKMWTPFFTTRAQGTGLGLPFVKEIVAAHHGDIEVTTSAEGTRFVLTLPTEP